MAVRGIGPSLAQSGVTNALADPTLELVDANGRTLGTNDDWAQDPQASALQAEGLAPSDPHEPAIFRTDLAPGAYTAIVRGKNATSGVGLVDIYVF